MYALLIAVLLVLVILSFPHWPYSASWGYGPTGVLGLVLIIAVIVILVRGAP